MNALDVTKELVAFASPSHRSNVEISDFVEEQLRRLDFQLERVEYTDPDGTLKVNVVGCRAPAMDDASEPGLAYFGHSDVVPADDWDAPTDDPFSPQVVGERLYGRGSCDMKGSVACMLSALHRIGQQRLKAPIYFVCTADEEVSYRGAHQLVARSEMYREMVKRQTRALIGEPTCLEIVHAHKGICGFRVMAHGEAAHSATAAGRNANLDMIPFLQEMREIYFETEAAAEWQHHEFSPTSMSWNIGINDFTKAVNMKPARSVCTVFFRPLPGIDETPLLDRARRAAQAHGLEFTMFGHCSAVYTAKDDTTVQDALRLAGKERPMTVSYGTDAGELTELLHKFVCGPGNINQAHTKDEWIDIEQLEHGTRLFEQFLRAWCVADE